MEFDMPSEAGQLIPFGKYRGQPLEVLTRDAQYRDWLMAQDWFRVRYPQMVQVIVNNFGAPAETPEHNQMQARFLDGECRLKFAFAVTKIAVPTALQVAASFADKLKEQFQKYDCDRERWIAALRRRAVGLSFVRTGKPAFEDGSRAIDVVFWVDWIVGYANLRIEIKPSIGDDFPAVLRQMRDKSVGLLYYRSYSGQGVNEATFREYFASQGIKVVSEQEVERVELPTIELITEGIINLAIERAG
ncbi:MAG: hypothetical protein AB7I37_26240 [Pirellulales bacterium]